MDYFIIINDKQEGPFPLEELLQHGLKSETLVWTEGMTDWQPAWKVEELRQLLFRQTDGGTATPPPMPAGMQPQSTDPFQGGDGTGGTQPAAPQTAGMQSPKKNRRIGKIIGVVAALLLVIMAASNPSANDHKQVLRKQLTAVITRHIGSDSDDDAGGFLSQMMGGMARMIALNVLERGLDTMVDYHNYIVCSTTTFHLGEKSYTSSFGIFGHVFTADEEQLSEKFGEVVNVERKESSSTTPDGTSTTQSIEATVGDSVKSITTRMGRQIGSSVATKVGEEVKKQVSEQTDSATSSGIGHIIDEIVSLFE